MRCDNCPLCPTAEDDVCPEMEGEYGIEHKDGMGGCRHPYNWAKVRADEYADYLGKMADGMMADMRIEHEGFVKGFNSALDECVKLIVNTPTKVGTHLKEPQRVDTCLTMLADRQNEIIDLVESLKIKEQAK